MGITAFGFGFRFQGSGVKPEASMKPPTGYTLGFLFRFGPFYKDAVLFGRPPKALI